jgi:hypothetical protein
MTSEKGIQTNLFRYLAFFSAAIILFSRQFNTRPIFDDFVYFLWFDSADRQGILHLLNPRSGYFWFRPLALLICYLEHAVFGMFMPGYRVAGIAWHAGNAFLVWRIAQHNMRMAPGAALAAGWLFLLHPAAVQSICYPSGQSETIYLLFMLSALHMFLTYYLNTGTVRSLSGGCVLLCLALLTKETAFALIAVLPGIVILYYRNRGVRSKGLALVVVSACAGTLYLAGRTVLYKGIGGYGLMVPADGLFKSLLSGPVRKWCVDYPAAHFFPLTPGMIRAAPYLPAITAVLTALLLIQACRHKTTLQNFLSSVWILAVSSAMLVLVVPYLDAHMLPPRYLYLGSAAVALILGPLFNGRYAMKKPVILVIAGVWCLGQYGFQRDFHRAGLATEYVLSTLDNYCFHLEAGGRIEVYNVPDRIGSVSINIPDKRDTVFNLEAHRRCDLAPLLDLRRGQGRDNWTQYMESLPGQVSVFRYPAPAGPPRPDTLVFVLDVTEAFN